MIPEHFLRVCLLTSALGLAACDSSSESSDTAGAAGGGASEPVVEATESVAAEVEVVEDEPELPVVSVAERAEALGFGSRLAADADLFMAIYDGADLVRDIGELELWQFFRDWSREQEGVDPQEEIEAGAAQAEAIAGREFFFSLGAGAAEQFGLLSELGQLVQYHRTMQTARSFAEGLVGGDLDGAMMGAMGDMEWIEGMVGESETWLPLVERFEVPPLLLGLRIEQEEAMGATEQQLRQLLGMTAEGSEPIEFSRGGAAFQGNLYRGEVFAGVLAEGAEEMEPMIGKDAFAKLVESLRQKQLVVAVGRLDTYLMFFIGSAPEACPIVEDVDQSLAASGEARFIDGFIGKPIHGAVTASEALVKRTLDGSLHVLAEAIRDGLQGVEGLGNVRDLTALLGMVGEREEALLELSQTEPLGAVISLDQGLRLDLFGGVRSGSLDLERPHRLSALGEADEVVLFANWVGAPEFSTRATELFELLVEVGYAAAGHVGRFGDKSKALSEFNSNLTLFDEMFRDKLLDLWQGLEAMEKGLGEEAALVVDVAGQLPEMPMIPGALAKEGRVPQLAYVAPVRDRAALGEAWGRIGKTIEVSVAMANSTMGLEMPIPKALAVGEGDLRHWHLNLIPDAEGTDSHLGEPMVSVSDDWFVASNSMVMAESLTEALASDNEPRRGLWVELDVEVLRRYLEKTLQLMERQSGDWFADDVEQEDFREMVAMSLKGLAASKSLESVTIHERMEKGTRRATLHFHQAE